MPRIVSVPIVVNSESFAEEFVLFDCCGDLSLQPSSKISLQQAANVQRLPVGVLKFDSAVNAQPPCQPVITSQTAGVQFCVGGKILHGRVEPLSKPLCVCRFVKREKRGGATEQQLTDQRTTEQMADISDENISTSLISKAATTAVLCDTQEAKVAALTNREHVYRVFGIIKHKVVFDRRPVMTGPREIELFAGEGASQAASSEQMGAT